MELTQLRYFVAVAEELHFGKAARKLNMTQPPLSVQIRNLEEELEISLFNRTSRSVELTEAGSLFLKDARELLNRAGDSVSNLRSLAHGGRFHLKLGFNELAINTFLPRLIKKSKQKNPEALLTLEELETGEQIDALRERRINLGFARLFNHDIPDLSTLLLLKDKNVLALPSGHAASKSDMVSVDALRSEPLIIFPRKIQPELHDCIMSRMEARGFRPALIQEAVTKQTTLALVEAGMGLALVPASMSGMKRGGVEYRRIDCDLPDIGLHAVWRRGDDSGGVRRFIDLLSPAMADDPPERCRRQGHGAK